MLASKKNCTLILRATDIAFNVRLAAGVRLQQIAAIRAKHQRSDRSHGEPSAVAISKLSRAARVCEDGGSELQENRQAGTTRETSGGGAIGTGIRIRNSVTRTADAA